MPKYPEPHIEREWPPDFVEDYAHAKSDEERRIMLLRFGYDNAHYGDVLYLFGEPTAASSTDDCVDAPAAPQTVSTQLEQANPITHSIKKVGKGIADTISFAETLFSLMERIAKHRTSIEAFCLMLISFFFR